MRNIRTGSLAFKNFDGFLIALTGLLFLLIYTSHSGIGISPDSIAYLSTARNINEHGLLTDYTLKPLVDFPVIYPIFLSIVAFLSRTDLVILGPYLNAILFAGVIISLGYIIDTFEFTTPLYKRILLMLIAISPSMIDVYSMLWSETLFILLSLIFILCFSKYLKKRSAPGLLLSALLAGIACITRYAGITLVATGLMFLLFDPTLEWKKKIKHLFLFGISSITLLVINLVHNRMAAGLSTGPRQSGITPLRDNIHFYGDVICKWLAIPASQPVVIPTVVFLLFILALILFFRRSWFTKTYTSPENIFTTFFIVYTVFIIGISTLTHFEQINNRLLSPLFIPLLITLTSWIPVKLSQLNGTLKKFALALIVVLTLSFEFNQLSHAHEMYTEARDYGIAGYTDDSWKNSDISKFLRKNPTLLQQNNNNVFSNAEEAVYFNGKSTAEALPHVVDTRDIKTFFSKKGLYLIWFDQIDDEELISLETIHKHAEVEKRYDFKDGTIYFVTPHHDAK